MSMLRRLSVPLVLVLAAMVTAEILAEQPAGKLDVTVRKVEQQTVLYTIYRGDYEKIGKPISGLYALAVKNKIWPHGSLSCVYLNNPQYVSREHLLTEIRIPVGEDALKLAGTLGEMTDVKTLPAMEVAVATKPAGQEDPDAIYDALGAWILKHGCLAVEGPCEKFLTDAQTGNYAQMKSEIMVPIRKFAPTD